MYPARAYTTFVVLVPTKIALVIHITTTNNPETIMIEENSTVNRQQKFISNYVYVSKLQLNKYKIGIFVGI